MDESLTNLIVIGACALVWLVALVAGIWRVRHTQDRHGLILAVVALLGLLLLILFATGTQYGARVSSAIRERIAGPPAALITEWKGRGELRVHLGAREIISQSDSGRYVLQPGTLRLDSFTAYAGTGDSTYEARTELGRETVTLAPGQEQPMVAGPPYTATVESNPRLNRLELKVKDSRGRDTRISDSRRTSPPGFEVLDAHGKVVWQGKFAYG